MEGAALAAAGFGIGAALAGAPGPVQAVIVAEAARGGVRRGFQALAGASGTFALLLVAMAIGVSVAPPRGVAMHLLELAGGSVLLWLAWDGMRSDPGTEESDRRGPGAPPAVRGAMSVALNPGAWLFLGAVAAPLLASATASGGPGGSMMVAAALAAGAASGDSLVVLAGGVGLRRLSDRARRRTNRLLNLLLAGLGGWLLVTGAVAVAETI